MSGGTPAGDSGREQRRVLSRRGVVATATAATIAFGIDAAARLRERRPPTPDSDPAPIQVSTRGDDVNGTVAIEEDGANDFFSWTGSQTWTENPPMRLRVSRAESDDRGGRHLLLVPYAFGMAVEYAGVIEVWSQELSVHNNSQGGNDDSAKLWVGNHTDTGGVAISASDRPGSPKFAQFAAQTFSEGPHGDIRFVVREPNGRFDFRVGPPDGEQAVAAVTAEGTVQAGGDVSAQGDVSATNIRAADRVIANGGLAVGNSSDASRPGRVVRRIEVFDGEGQRLGFIPVYDRIER